MNFVSFSKTEIIFLTYLYIHEFINTRTEQRMDDPAIKCPREKKLLHRVLQVFIEHSIAIEG